MRIDSDACRDPDLLAAEVRRLRAVIAAGEPVLADEERAALGVALQTLVAARVQRHPEEEAACNVLFIAEYAIRRLLERQNNLSAGQAPAR